MFFSSCGNSSRREGSSAAESAQFEDPELLQLVHMLPGILVKDRAEKTVNTYVNAFRRWKVWATQHGLVALPAEPVSFSLYLVYLIQQVRSVAAINSIVYGVGWSTKKVGS